MNWEALNNALIFRRKVELVVKYQKAVPGIIQAQRYFIACREMGKTRWGQVLCQFEGIPLIKLEEMMTQVDAEIELRLERHHLPLPV
jgi:hypothetical protein